MKVLYGVLVFIAQWSATWASCGRCNNIRATLYCLEDEYAYEIGQTEGLACEVVTGGITMMCEIEGLVGSNVTSYTFKSGTGDVGDYSEIDRSEDSSNGTTVVSSVSEDVVYVCEASVKDMNGDSHTIRSNTLIVKKVYQNSSELTVPSSATAMSLSVNDSYVTELECTYPSSWYPEPYFMWYKDGAPVEDSVRVFSLHFAVGDYSRGSLIIHGYETTDLGNYTCQIMYVDLNATLTAMMNQTSSEPDHGEESEESSSNSTSNSTSDSNSTSNSTSSSNSTDTSRTEETEVSDDQGGEEEGGEEGEEGGEEGEEGGEEEEMLEVEMNITVAWYNVTNGTVSSTANDSYSYDLDTQNYDEFVGWGDPVTVTAYAIGGFVGNVTYSNRTTYSWQIVGAELGLLMLNTTCVTEVQSHEGSDEGGEEGGEEGEEGEMEEGEGEGGDKRSSNSSSNSTSSSNYTIEDYYQYDQCLYWGTNTTSRTLDLTSSEMAKLGIEQEGPNGNTLTYEYSAGFDTSDIKVTITYNGGSDDTAVEKTKTFDNEDNVIVVSGMTPPSDDSTCAYNDDTPTLPLSNEFYQTFKSEMYQVLADYELRSTLLLDNTYVDGYTESSSESIRVSGGISSTTNKCLYYQVERRNKHGTELYSYLYQTILVEALGDQGSNSEYNSSDYSVPSVAFVDSAVQDKLKYINCQASNINSTGTLNWVELDPWCEAFDLSPVTCSAPSIGNATLSPTTLSVGVGSSYTVSCSSGYTMSGSETVTCGSDGNFTTLPWCAKFTTVTTNSSITFDLESIPLQIKTDSSAGDSAIVKALFYESDGTEIGYFAMTFNSGGQIGYHIDPCMTGYTNFTSLPSSDYSEKIWIITKTSSTLTVTCNDTTVLTYKYTDSAKSACPTAFAKTVAKIMFGSTDTGSDGYLAKPTDTSTSSDDCSYETTVSFDMTKMTEPCMIMCMAKSQCTTYATANTTVEPIYCELPHVANGTFIDSEGNPAAPEVIYNSTLTFECEDGFQKEGPDMVTCTGEGELDDEVSCADLNTVTCVTLDPGMGTMTCDSSSSTISCTYHCPDDTYFADNGTLKTNKTVTCDSSTALWSHMSTSNTLGTFANCAEKVTPTSYLLSGSIGFSGATACIDGTAAALVTAITNSNASAYNCIDSGHCTMSGITCSSASSGLTLSYKVNQTSGDLTSSTTIDDFETQLKSDASGMSLTLSIASSRKKRQSTTTLTTDGTITATSVAGCADGSGYVGTSCIECAAGQYETGSVCTDCAANYYSNSTGSTSCTACSGSLKTITTGSDSETDCTVLCNVASVDNALRAPSEGYNVSTGTVVSTICDTGYSVQESAASSGMCNATAPSCYSKCSVTSVDARAEFETTAVTSATELSYLQTVAYTCTSAEGEAFSVTCAVAGTAYSLTCPTSYVAVIAGVITAFIVLIIAAVVYKVVQIRNRPIHVGTPPPLPTRRTAKGKPVVLPPTEATPDLMDDPAAALGNVTAGFGEGLGDATDTLFSAPTKAFDNIKSMV